jgi:cytochrome c556
LHPEGEQYNARRERLPGNQESTTNVREDPMRNARWIWAAVATLSIMAVAAPAPAAEEDEEKASWMKKKLEYTDEVLAALTREDFEQISKSARTMNNLGYLERWVRAGSPEYRRQLRIFQSANKQLIEMADEKNLDGAALAYVQLTLSCVNCHKHVRDTAPTKATSK